MVAISQTISFTFIIFLSLFFYKPNHIDVEAGFQSLKSTIAETGMGVTSRP